MMAHERLKTWEQSLSRTAATRGRDKAGLLTMSQLDLLKLTAEVPGISEKI